MSIEEDIIIHLSKRVTKLEVNERIELRNKCELVDWIKELENKIKSLWNNEVEWNKSKWQLEIEDKITSLEAMIRTNDGHIDDLLARVGQIDIYLAQKNPVSDLAQNNLIDKSLYTWKGDDLAKCLKEVFESRSNISINKNPPNSIRLVESTNNILKNEKLVEKKIKTLWIVIDKKPREDGSHITSNAYDSQQIIDNPYSVQVKIEVEVEEDEWLK